MKKIITKETIALVQNTYDEYAKKSSKELCVPFPIEKGDAIAVGLVRIVNDGKDTYLYLAEGVNKLYLKDWSEDVGQIINNDCRKSTTDGKYFHFKAAAFDALLRRISDEELADMKSNGFDHVTLGDFHYTIIKVIGNRIIDTWNAFDRVEDVPVAAEDPDDDYKLVEEPEQESISLFE